MHVFVVRGLLLQHSARETLKIRTFTMNLPALNVDVLLHLMKFVKPGDRFNLALSGILKGFENANEGIDFCERYSKHFTVVQCKCQSNCYLPRIENCGAELGLRRDSTCELEIR